MVHRPPEEFDLVAVTIKHVDYYGYISEIDWDMRQPRICVEFYPGNESWFDFNECRIMDYPMEKYK